MTTQPDPHTLAVAVDAVKRAINFLNDFAKADLDEIAADGGVTVGMVFQQQARWEATKLSRAALEARPQDGVEGDKTLADLALAAALMVTRRAQRFCEVLQEDGEGVPQPELRELHAALDEFEAFDAQGEKMGWDARPTQGEQVK